MRFNFSAPALAAEILIGAALTILPVEAVAEPPIVHAHFCPTLKEMMRYTDAFYKTRITSLDYESDGGDKYWFTSFRVEGSKDCYISQQLSNGPHEYYMDCIAPVLPPATGQETYERLRQVVSDCISEINPDGRRYGESTKGIDGFQRTYVGFRFEEGENTFNVFVTLQDNPDEELSVSIVLRSWRD